MAPNLVEVGPLALDVAEQRLYPGLVGGGAGAAEVLGDRAQRPDRSVQDDLRAIDEAFGAWAGRDVDGAEYVRQLRSGKRLAHR